MLPSHLVVFTDLDGTLLDARTYSWAAAEEALAEIARRRIPLVFVTSKTRAEVEALQRKLGAVQPFVTENGGGIFFPYGYFPQRIAGLERTGRYHCLPLARPYAQVIEELDAVAEETEVEIAGFHEMTAREVTQNTGLPRKQAELARQREFDEPFFFAGADEKKIQQFAYAAKLRGITIARGGRFWHAFAGSDKGQAVRKLMKLYREALRSRQRSIGLGDSANDLPMLEAVDVPILIPQPGGQVDAALTDKLPRAMCAPTPGPAGWNEAILELLAGK